jgi:UDP:flavonoid glycosyltransferase YjiC (YdhE family)
VRVVVAASLGGAGHLEPVAAVGRGLRAQGDDVTVLVPHALEGAASGCGLDVVLGDEPDPEIVRGYLEHLTGALPDADPGRLDRELFADHCTRALLPAATDLIGRWRPELVLREPTEYASVVASLRSGVAFGTVAISQARIEAGVRAMVAPVLDRIHPGTADAIERAPFLTNLPARLDPSPWTTTVRYRVPDDEPVALPAWWGARGGPLVYVTFGSVVGHTGLAAGVFRTTLAALEELDARVLLTVGRRFDLDLLGAVPANVHVEPWVPQSSVLATCAVVVCHGGSGTTYGALRAGVPLVVCPLYADNAHNGAAVAEAGAGVVVAPEAGRSAWATESRELSATLCTSVSTVLDTPSFREAAYDVAAEMARYPLAADAVRSTTWSLPR